MLCSLCRAGFSPVRSYQRELGRPASRHPVDRPFLGVGAPGAAVLVTELERPAVAISLPPLFPIAVRLSANDRQSG